MMGAFFIRRSGDRDHAVAASIQRSGDASDRTTLARRIHAFKHHDDTALLGLQLAAEPIESRFKLIQLAGILNPLELLLQIQAIEDCARVRGGRRGRGFFLGLGAS